MDYLRECRSEDFDTVVAIINAAAEAYRGVIPPDRWHDPYMPAEELRREIAAGVCFTGHEEAGSLVGVMGVQPVRDVHLIRHAYVLPSHQGQGIGSALLRHCRERTEGPILIGTWAAAHWAIRFYQREGFRLVPGERAGELLSTYWNIPERQVHTSVVLAGRGISDLRAG